LLRVYRFSEYQVRADAKRFRDTHLPFYHCDAQRAVVQAGVAGAFEEECGIFLVLAVDNYRIESFVRQFLYGYERLERKFDREIQFAKYFRDQARRGLIWAEK
jgi:hypothetical protein